MYQKSKTVFAVLLIAACSVLLSAIALKADEETPFRILKDNALEVNGKKVVLYGIAIPGPKTKCIAKQAQWPCGATATLKLATTLSFAPFSCVPVSEIGTVPLVRCANREFDVADWLVREGWAVTVVDGQEYSRQEQIARHRQAGIWMDGFEAPEEWRVYPTLEINFLEDLECSECAARKQ